MARGVREVPVPVSVVVLRTKVVTEFVAKRIQVYEAAGGHRLEPVGGVVWCDVGDTTEAGRGDEGDDVGRGDFAERVDFIHDPVVGALEQRQMIAGFAVMGGGEANDTDAERETGVGEGVIRIRDRKRARAEELVGIVVGHRQRGRGVAPEDIDDVRVAAPCGGRLTTPWDHRRHDHTAAIVINDAQGDAVVVD